MVSSQGHADPSSPGLFQVNATRISVSGRWMLLLLLVGNLIFRWRYKPVCLYVMYTIYIYVYIDPIHTNQIVIFRI